MTSIVAPAADLEFLDHLMTSDDVWVQGAEEGLVVARHILDSSAEIIVLYGPARGGITEFMRRWVVPALERKWQVAFHERGTAPAVLRAGADVEFWDGFETCVSDAEGQSHTVLEHIARSATAAGKPHKIVLILQEDYLNRLFQLRSTVPGILDDLFEIPTMPAARFIDALRRTVSRYGVGIDDACRAALARDLDAVRTDGALGPELVAILAFELLRARGAVPLVATADYDALGGVKGILGSHIDFLLEHVPGGHDPEIGWAVLQRAVRTPVDVMTDLTDVAYRFDVPVTVPQAVLAWLEQDRRVLRANTGGGHDIVPGLLALAVVARARRLDELTENVRAMLRYGVRQFAESGALLPDQYFRRVDELRSSLTTTEDEATLMLRSALAHSYVGAGVEIEHWLRRVRSETTKIEILIDVLFDLRPEIRARAATFLRAFNTPEVRAQLHLAALRDTDQGVRSAAADSLGVLGTDELCATLVQETKDPNSPFHLQAIDALRVFRDRTAVDALVQIVSGAGPARDRVARARALAALGAHDTDVSRLALVRIALSDPDPDDRAAALEEIEHVSSEQAAAQVLAAVSEAPSPSRNAWWQQLSSAGFGKGIGGGVAAVAAIVSNTIVHGALLATIGKTRLAIIIAVAEVVIIAAAYMWRSDLWLFWWLTWLTGYLAPTHVLLQRRSEGRPMTSYQRSVGRALFIVGCVTGFLLLHGLASMLTRHFKRALILTAFEGAGVGLVVMAIWWYADLGLDSSALRAVFWQTYAATWILLVAGILVFATTYVLGIRTAAADLFTSRERRTESDRRRAIHLALLRNPHAVAVVVNDLGSADRARAHAAAALCARFARILRPPLRDRWAQADEVLKARIATLMARQPDPASVEFLQSVAATRRERRRAAGAMWKLRLAIWPPVVRVAVLLGLGTLLLYVAMLHENHTNGPSMLLNVAQGSDDNDAVRAITTLGALANADHPALSAPARRQVEYALSRSDVVENAVRASALVRALPRERPPEVVKGLGAVIDLPSTDAETRRAAIDALRSLGTAEAGDALRHFVESGGAERNDLVEVTQLKFAAIDAIGHMQNVWALRALQELQLSPALVYDLKIRAGKAASQIDSLVWSEYFLERSEFDKAIDAAQNVVRNDGDVRHAAQVASALAKVHAVRGLASTERGDYAAATQDLGAALKSGAPPTSLTGAVALAQQLGYRLHETEALQNPEAYELSYRTFKSIQEIGPHFGDALAIDTDASIAEAALTSGRHDEALQLAREVDRRASQRPESAATVIPMRIIAAAALALKGDERGARKALESLRGQNVSPNGTWQYDGTVHYLRTAGLSAEMRRLLLAEIVLVS